MKAARWSLSLLAVVGVLLTLLILLTPQGRTAFHTALFVMQVLEMPVQAQSWFTDEPLRHRVHFPTFSGASEAEVYRLPDGNPQPAVVLSLGVANEGFSDPRVVNLGNALSRAGVVVMIYWSPEMVLRHQLDPDEPDKLVSAYLYLAEQDYVDPERVGIGGFSAGAAFALMAAADRRIRDQIYLVNVFGPYFDAETLLLQATSRSAVYEGEQRPWEPDWLVMQVLATELIEVLNNPEEAALLTRRYVDGHTISSEKLGGLSSQGKVIVRLLDGVSLEEAKTLYGLLPSSKRRELAQISPATYISDVRARVLVLHDYNDNMVPSSESRRLMEALKSRGNIRYTEVRSFDHATLDRSSVLAYLGDAHRLYRHMYEILRVAS